jgi:precorrin-6B methylase 2
MRSLAKACVPLLCLLLTAGAAPEQSAPTTPKEYEPLVGQEGKDVVWVPTADPLVEKMLDLAKVASKDYVIDLGSGDGRTVIAAARRGARAVGIEFNPDLVALSQRNAAAAGVAKRATFTKADLYTTDLSRATVVTMFLLPEINIKLRPTLLSLAPGTRIVSNTFTMGDWEADATATVGEGAACSNWCTALLWIVPAKVAGQWHVSDGDLVLEQEYQKISGSLGPRRISNGRLRGTDISFSVGTARYSGTVRADSMSGTVTRRGQSNIWAATRSDSDARRSVPSAGRGHRSPR